MAVGAVGALTALYESDALRLITDLVGADDAISVALVCRALRDAVFTGTLAAGAPRKSAPRAAPRPPLLRTRARAYISPVARLRWALEHARCPVYPSALSWAAEAGDVASLEHLWHLQPAANAPSAPRAPVWPAHWPPRELEAATPDERALPMHVDGFALCEAAAAGGHVRALAWLRARGCAWSVTVTNTACLHGHLDVLRWAVEVRMRAHARACARASLALPPGSPSGPCACHAPYGARPTGAARGRIPRYLPDQHGCPTDSLACHLAATHGDVRVMAFLHSRGFSW